MQIRVLEYRQKNRKKLTLMAREWRLKNKDYYDEWLKVYFSKNIEQKRQNARLRFLRYQQKVLALRYLENKEIKPYTYGLFSSVST